jgi:hypothetical protein
MALALLFALEYDNTEVQVNYKGLQSKNTHRFLIYTDYGANSLHENTDIIKKTWEIYYSLKIMSISK